MRSGNLSVRTVLVREDWRHIENRHDCKDLKKGVIVGWRSRKKIEAYLIVSGEFSWVLAGAYLCP